MRHAGNVPAKRIVDLLLARRVDQVIVAANDMGDAHVVVVDHHGQHIGRGSVAAEQDEIVEVFVLPDDAALHLILDHGFSGLGRAQANGRLDPGRGFGRIAVAPQAVVKTGAALGAGFLAHRRELFGRGVTIIGLAGRQQAFGDLAMTACAAELVDDLAVPIELEPFEAIQDRGNRCVGRSLPVGILDPEQHLAAVLARIEPVEQGRAGSSDMEKTGRRGGKARNDGCGHEHQQEGRIPGRLRVYIRNPI